jgi:hypothetical protein
MSVPTLSEEWDENMDNSERYMQGMADYMHSGPTFNYESLAYEKYVSQAWVFGFLLIAESAWFSVQRNGMGLSR